MAERAINDAAAPDARIERGVYSLRVIVNSGVLVGFEVGRSGCPSPRKEFGWSE
jgi:hypothetical protein